MHLRLAQTSSPSQKYTAPHGEKKRSLKKHCTALRLEAPLALLQLFALTTRNAQASKLARTHHCRFRIQEQSNNKRINVLSNQICARVTALHSCWRRSHEGEGGNNNSVRHVTQRPDENVMLRDCLLKGKKSRRKRLAKTLFIPDIILTAPPASHRYPRPSPSLRPQARPQPRTRRRPQ